MPNNTFNKERKIFEGFHIGAGKFLVVLSMFVLGELNYYVLPGVRWLIYTKADIDFKTMNLKTGNEEINTSLCLTQWLVL